MDNHLRELLRSLCSDTEWNYAFFWKLKHRVPMVLTCEDAYYYNCFEHETSESKSFSDALGRDCHFAHEPLGLAVTKMSYHVYSLGEGIVGQVAVTGNHQWIFAGDHPMNSFLSPELCDRWQTQLSVGIKTIVVAAVPHGVVQLGSLSKINEDLKLLSHIRDIFSSLQDCSSSHIRNPINFNMDKAMLDLEKSRLFLANNFESTACKTEIIDIEEHPSKVNLRKLVENNADIQPQSDLYEALRPVFLKQSYAWSCEVKDTKVRSTSDIPVMVERSMLTSDSASDNLLEASAKSTVSFSTSESILTTEKNYEPYTNRGHTHGSSDSCSVRLSTSECREPFMRPIELGKSSKKRARPSGSCRPQPRDRQLIEDRIKELRRLVPNGAKCSIDSLLERTIKHVMFLENAATNADKLINCPISRGCSDETRRLRSGYEQGSCWAVEVGDHMNICPIVVENLDMNGQMLIEMLCDDCHHFLEIAEAIRNLGLTILEGSTNNRGDKIWMRFVVKGRGKRILHRTEILWSLLQLLQFETTA